MRTLARRSRAAIPLLLAALAAVVPATRADDAPKAGKTVRLFVVGNSFSGNATRYLGDLTKAAGHTLVLRSASVGGSSLELHWGKAERFEKDPKDPAGLYASKKGLTQELAAGPWDFVTIQQASIRSHDVDTYRPFAKKLHDAIKKHAPGAELLLHQTWAYRVDDKRFNAKTPPAAGEPATQEAMYRGLTNAYRTIAGELGVRVIPTGDAFYLADGDPTWGYRVDPKFDAATAQSPTLPDQRHSLHVGWQWKPGKDGKPSLAMDGHHASNAGQYLGACVWYEVLFNESVVGNTFVPGGLDKAYAGFLRETAHRAVAESRQRVGAVPAGR